MSGGGVAEIPPDGASAEEASSIRVNSVQQAADAALADGQVYACSTPWGEVHVCGVTSGAGDGAHWVDVVLQGGTEGGDPHFRIVNPPLLVPDPSGPIEINGTRYREDPLAAIAHVVASLGGATTSKVRLR